MFLTHPYNPQRFNQPLNPERLLLLPGLLLCRQLLEIQIFSAQKSWRLIKDLAMLGIY